VKTTILLNEKEQFLALNHTAGSPAVPPERAS